MIDTERIVRRLADIEHYSNVLSKIVPNNYDDYIKSDITTKAAVERYLQLINDLELEVLVLVYKGLDLGISGGDESLVNKFNDLLSKKAIEGFKKRRSLRNILVHAYFEMHYDKDTFNQANDLSDIKDFVKGIRLILEKQ